ncbi:M23 family metallopeptidase [Cellulomonas endophytica]|uniref:M23 family metallopeptidase n=1 Tax=Cellulomonas endophytica TaxID=2494735 RepID=UPI001010B41B|nr:M23 family metallopeptidase [Cellulomonas endophytica]
MVVLALPFAGRWRVENSPARRVPSHGTDLMGQRYAIDFVGVDARGRSSPVRDLRTVLGTEPPERFVGFGRPVLAPGDGVVVVAHDGEADYAARRSPLTLLPYALGQPGRLRAGTGAVAGNHVVLALADGGPFVALVHLRAGSLRVAVGDRVVTGTALGACGSSGNSTQPHVHVQVMDDLDLARARGVPSVFAGFREWPRHGGGAVVRDVGVPAEGAVVEALGTGPGAAWQER